MILFKNYNLLLFITTLICWVNTIHAVSIPIVDDLLHKLLPHKYQPNNNNKPRYFELDISQGRYDPDCSGYHNPKLLINGQLPGPPIEVTRGDRVQILVRNNLPTESPIKFSNFSANGGLSNDMTIHIHGIRQLGSPEADGVPYLTQDPIPAGGSYLYDFYVPDQSGTYFYHAHVGLDAESVFGAFIVYESEKARPGATSKTGTEVQVPSLVAGPYRYDEERLIMLSEWWHNTADEVTAEILSPNFDGIPEPPSILINGRTIYGNGQVAPNDDINILDPKTILGKLDDPLSLVQSNLPHLCEGYTAINLDPSKTYRVRVIGSNIYRTLKLAVADHELTVMEVDGTIIQPRKVPYLEVAPGQRFSILIEPSNRRGDFAVNTIRGWVEPEVDRSSNGLAVFRYGAPGDVEKHEVTTTQVPMNRFQFPEEDRPYWFWDDMEPSEDVIESQSYDNFDDPPSRTLLIDMQAGAIPSGETRWFINNVTFMDPPETILTNIYNGQRPLPNYDQVNPITGYDEKLGTYPIRKGEIIDFVLQNSRQADQPCRSHPWHMHGHSFYSLAYGAGRYNHDEQKDVRTVSEPFLRDVLTLYPADTVSQEETTGLPGNPQIPCGWSKIRFIADNPGVWAMHCHNTPHMIMGMMIALELGAEELQKTGLH